jgi:transposase
MWHIKKLIKQDEVLSHYTMPQMLREHAIGMLTAGMSTRAVAREFHVHFSTISRHQRRFREFGSTSN